MAIGAIRQCPFYSLGIADAIKKMQIAASPLIQADSQVFQAAPASEAAGNASTPAAAINLDLGPSPAVC